MDDDPPRDGKWNRRSFLSALGSLGLLGSASGISVAQTGRDPGPKPNEILVGKTDDLEPANARASIQSTLPPGAEVVHEIEQINCFVVDPPEATTAAARESLKEYLGEQPTVTYAEDNVTIELIPNDPSYADGDQYVPDQINAPAAWESTTGDSDVLVAVVDTGIDYEHPDLAPVVTDAVSNHGRDFVTDDDDPFPTDPATEFHGTHVAGIACGATDNEEGIAGISDCSLLCCRALTAQGGAVSDVAEAIVYATDQDADVINLSLGGREPSQAIEDALARAVEEGSLPIASAGNDGKEFGTDDDGEEYHMYPAEYPEVLCVSAVDSSGSFAGYSNYGEAVDICAPGSDVLSTVPRDMFSGLPPYGRLSGTSMACAVVSGVAGLALSQSEYASVSDLRAHIQSNATDLGLAESKQGAGQIDAAAAVSAPKLDVSGMGDAVSAGESAMITLNLSNTGTTNAVGPALKLSGIPESWSVVDIDSDGGTFQSDSYTWIWLGLQADTSRTPSVTMSVPSNASGETHQLTAEAIEDGDTVSSTAVLVDVDGATMAQRYDANGDNDDVLDLEELQNAMTDWQQDGEEAPTLSQLQSMIRTWQRGDAL